jgi:hypothetical protein
MRRNDDLPFGAVFSRKQKLFEKSAGVMRIDDADIRVGLIG